MAAKATHGVCVQQLDGTEIWTVADRDGACPTGVRKELAELRAVVAAQKAIGIGAEKPRRLEMNKLHGNTIDREIEKMSPDQLRERIEENKHGIADLTAKIQATVRRIDERSGATQDRAFVAGQVAKAGDPVLATKLIHKAAAYTTPPGAREPVNFSGLRDPQDITSENDIAVETHKAIVAGRKDRVPALEQRLKELRDERRQRELGLR